MTGPQPPCVDEPPGVVKLKLGDIVVLPDPLALMTWKLYSVPALSPLSVWLWLLTSVLSRVVELPYEVVVPYRTCDVAGALVVHVTVVLDDVVPEVWTAEICGSLAPSDA
jgi:hypothetical protein